MRLISYYLDDGRTAAALVHPPNDQVHDVGDLLGRDGPIDMLTVLRDGLLPQLQTIPLGSRQGRPLEELEKLAAPLPNPTSFRDFYAFEQHVKTSRGRRDLEMIPEWYEIPVFYFSNHQAVLGPEEALTRPASTQWLDYELEVAAVIGRRGRDIPVAEADAYIAGYTILNDWSARDVQRQEMKVGLGPAKGKDFGSSFGPWLVTPDELADVRTDKGYDLTMTATRNGRELSHGNWKNITYSFAEMIARASADADLYPGDIIGSGTVGTGCILELGPDEAGGWLQPGDTVALSIERLGILPTKIM